MLGKKDSISRAIRKSVEAKNVFSDLIITLQEANEEISRVKRENHDRITELKEDNEIANDQYQSNLHVIKEINKLIGK